jgi:Domain of unknown function (DUF1905)
MSARYEFTAQLWRHDGAAAWHFVTLPVDVSKQIKTLAGGAINAFGSLRIKASIAGTSWNTSLFMDTKRNAFLLPVKAEVRRKARIGHGDEVAVSIELEL